MKDDCISRQEAIRAIEALQRPIMREASDYYRFKFSGMSEAREVVVNLPPVNPQEPKADYKAFAKWVADEIFSDKWELNKDAFAEIACRRLAELGMVEESGDRWVLMESEVQDADSD